MRGETKVKEGIWRRQIYHDKYKGNNFLRKMWMYWHCKDPLFFLSMIESNSAFCPILFKKGSCWPAGDLEIAKVWIDFVCNNFRPEETWNWKYSGEKERAHLYLGKYFDVRDVGLRIYNLNNILSAKTFDPWKCGMESILVKKKRYLVLSVFLSNYRDRELKAKSIN